MISQLVKNLIQFTKPIRYGLDNLLYAWSGESEHIASLKNKYKGEPMLVVGNGPSLNQTPLEEFLDIPAIGMNKIDLLYTRSKWRPSIVMCVNNMVVKQNLDAFQKNSVPVYLAWKARWFVKNRAKHIHYFDLHSDEEFQTDATKGFGSGVTVTYAALQMAYYMGADPVIVVGVDHNFDKVGGYATYEKRVGDDVNHFDPNYFKDGTVWGLPNLDASEEVYAKSRQAFEADGRKIYDATIGGKLQVFEKISIEEAIHMALSASSLKSKERIENGKRPSSE